MNVYTFYEPISSWDYDRSLVDLWVDNWSDKGFNPIVLSLQDSKSHEYYSVFSKTLHEFYYKMTSKKIIDEKLTWSYYIYYTYVRFLSYATLDTDNPIMIMDYDVYNVNLQNDQVSEIPENICFYFSSCPCFLTGSPLSFENMCRMFAFVMKNHADLIWKEYQSSPYSNRRVLHDMALIHCLKYSQNKILNDTLLENKISFSNKDKISKHLFHASNSTVRDYINNNLIDMSNISHEERINIRIRCAKEKINNANI